MKTFFFFWDHLFSAGKTTWKIPWNFSEDLFFWISPVWKPLEFLISAGKSLWIFAPHLVPLIQTRINFLCPRAPFEFAQNKLLVPPQNLLLPPSHAILAPGLTGGGPWYQLFLSDCDGTILVDFLTAFVQALDVFHFSEKINSNVVWRTSESTNGPS